MGGLTVFDRRLGRVVDLHGEVVDILRVGRTSLRLLPVVLNRQRARRTRRKRPNGQLRSFTDPPPLPTSASSGSILTMLYGTEMVAERGRGREEEYGGGDEGEGGRVEGEMRWWEWVTGWEGGERRRDPGWTVRAPPATSQLCSPPLGDDPTSHTHHRPSRQNSPANSHMSASTPDEHSPTRLAKSLFVILMAGRRTAQLF